MQVYAVLALQMQLKALSVCSGTGPQSTSTTRYSSLISLLPEAVRKLLLGMTLRLLVMTWKFWIGMAKRIIEVASGLSQAEDVGVLHLLMRPGEMGVNMHSLARGNGSFKTTTM